MSPLRTAIAPRTKQNARRITRPPFLYPCGFVCGATIVRLGGFRCHQGQKPLCHHSCRNSPRAEHPACPVRHRHPSRAVARFQGEDVGANRLQAVGEKSRRPPLAQLLRKPRARPRWHVAPPRHPVEHAPLTAPKRAALAPPVRDRAQADSVFRRQLPIRRNPRQIFPRLRFLAPLQGGIEDARLLIRQRAFRRQCAQFVLHRANGRVPRSGIDLSASHIRPMPLACAVRSSAQVEFGRRFSLRGGSVHVTTLHGNAVITWGDCVALARAGLRW